MNSPSVARHQAVATPSIAPRLDRVDPASTPGLPAANDDAAASPSEHRPNPLWAVNGALAAFLLVAALVLAGG